MIEKVLELIKSDEIKYEGDRSMIMKHSNWETKDALVIIIFIIIPLIIGFLKCIGFDI